MLKTVTNQGRGAITLNFNKMHDLMLQRKVSLTDEK